MMPETCSVLRVPFRRKKAEHACGSPRRGLRRASYVLHIMHHRSRLHPTADTPPIPFQPRGQLGRRPGEPPCPEDSLPVSGFSLGGARPSPGVINEATFHPHPYPPLHQGSGGWGFHVLARASVAAVVTLITHALHNYFTRLCYTQSQESTPPVVQDDSETRLGRGRRGGAFTIR